MPSSTLSGKARSGAFEYVKLGPTLLHGSRSNPTNLKATRQTREDPSLGSREQPPLFSIPPVETWGDHDGDSQVRAWTPHQ